MSGGRRGGWGLGRDGKRLRWSGVPMRRVPKGGPRSGFAARLRMTRLQTAAFGQRGDGASHFWATTGLRVGQPGG
jgi:hypothetical protein